MRRTLPMLAAALTAGLPGAVATASSGSGGVEAVHLVSMDELRVPILDGDRAEGTLSIRLVLDMADDEAVERATVQLPALRAASLATAIEFARLYASPLMPVDAERLAGDLASALHHEDPAIARVLLVQVQATRS